MQPIDIKQPINKSIKAILNYPEITVEQPQLSNNSLSNNSLSKDNLGKLFIKSTFKGKSNSPNVSYSNKSIPVNYHADQLYIYGKIHNISNLDWDGECIIKNISNTTNAVIYTVFLLKTSKNAKSNAFFDNLSKLRTTSTLDINELLNDSSSEYTILYKSGPNIKVIINTQIIKIKSDLKQFSNTQELFTSNPKNYSIIKNASLLDKVSTIISEGFQEGLEEIRECEMIDIGAPLANTYNIPVSSGALIDASKSDAATIFMNYIMYFIIFMFVFMGSPYFYDWIWLLDTTETNGLRHRVDFFGNHSRIGAIITIIFFCISLSFMIAGGVQKRTDYMAGGVIVAVAYAIGYISIIYKDLIKTATTAAAVATDAAAQAGINAQHQAGQAALAIKALKSP